MGTQISRGRGKLYRIGSEQFIDTVKYQLHEEVTAELARWWGDLTFTEYIDTREGDHYLIELEDGRKGGCYLKKLVNRPVSGVPARYVYRFTGNSPLE